MSRRWRGIAAGLAYAVAALALALPATMVLWTHVHYPESIRGPGFWAYMGGGPLQMWLLIYGLAAAMAFSVVGLVLGAGLGGDARRFRRRVWAVTSLVLLAAFIVPRFLFGASPLGGDMADVDRTRADFARYAVDQAWQHVATTDPVFSRLEGSRRHLALAVWVTGWQVTGIEAVPGTCRARDRGWRPGNFRGTVRFYGPFGIPVFTVEFRCPGGVELR